MADKETLDQARYILTTGKMIQDRIFRLHTAHFMASGKLDKFGDLSMPQMHAIMIVRMRGEVSMSELSGLLGVSPPSASAMVDRLVEKGILSRRHSKSDRRKVMVQVAPEAKEEIGGCEDKLLRSFVELVERVGPETACKWCEVLEKVKSALEEEV